MRKPYQQYAYFKDKNKCYCYFWYVLMHSQNGNVIIDKHILHFKTCYVIFTCNVYLYVLFLQLDNITALLSLHLLKENHQAPSLRIFRILYTLQNIQSCL